MHFHVFTLIINPFSQLLRGCPLVCCPWYDNEAFSCLADNLGSSWRHKQHFIGKHWVNSAATSRCGYSRQFVYASLFHCLHTYVLCNRRLQWSWGIMTKCVFWWKKLEVCGLALQCDLCVMFCFLWCFTHEPWAAACLGVVPAPQRDLCTTLPTGQVKMKLVAENMFVHILHHVFRSSLTGYASRASYTYMVGVTQNTPPPLWEIWNLYDEASLPLCMC